MRRTAVILLLLAFLLCTTGAVGAKDSSKVVITANGKKYHRPKCHMAKKYVKELTVEEAKKLGYKPCKICKP
ncbi:MAG: hypothetical protein IJG51_10950 [Synergistaceae bacterium]|nr:hypothetical protein [Synergistaceae bacterium]MBQ3347807.1 hypothetical protein [Synergistaceae bacterium]MBQ3399394.1 hypothetical protein [Synergistaceae bacterium]MBQ3759834.1 hypothetical protein [Synergistaceae bacterium]MBQ4402441.1 hypothetical protein [Synergistaceae bacterium]